MFSYLLKNLPTQYIYGAYVLRKSISTQTTEVDGKPVYDVTEFIYLDNYLTPFLLMDDGTYKSMYDAKVKLSPVDSDGIISKHIERTENVDMDEYSNYDKNTPIAIFGAHPFEELVKWDQAAASEDNFKDAAQLAQIGVKKSHTGMEIMAVLNRFHTRNRINKKTFCVPPIKKDSNDTYESIIGDINAYHEKINEKSNDEIVKILQELSEELDSVGNKKYETLGL